MEELTITMATVTVGAMVFRKEIHKTSGSRNGLES